MHPQQIDTYLARLDYDAPVAADLTTLAALQRKHMQTVPFENFDVFVGRALDLDPKALYDKVIEGRRGGYCFELNTLYASMLRALGFDPRPVLGRVRLRPTEPVPPRNHLANTVKLSDGRTYLTDVGFGGLTTRVPLPIDAPDEIDDGEGRIRLRTIGREEYLIERLTGEGWKPQYSFELSPVYPSDIQLSNHFTETHNGSHFRQGRFIGCFTEDGRIGLFENQFTRRVGPEIVHREEIADGTAWRNCIVQRFGINLDYSANEINRLLKVGEV